MKIARLKMLILFCVIVVGSLMGEGFNASSQPYRYGGKELVTLGGFNLSDFGTRWLDSPSGTFTTMDPLCEDFQHLTPPTFIVPAIQLNRIDDANEEIVLSSSMDIIETPLQIIYDRNGKGVFLLLIKRIIGKNFCM